MTENQEKQDQGAIEFKGKVPVYLILGALGAGGLFGVPKAWQEIKPALVNQAHAEQFVTRAQYEADQKKVYAQFESRHKWMMDQQRQMGEVSQKVEIMAEIVDDIDKRQRDLTNAVSGVSAQQGRMEVQIGDAMKGIVEILNRVPQTN